MVNMNSKWPLKMCVRKFGMCYILNKQFWLNIFRVISRSVRRELTCLVECISTSKKIHKMPGICPKFVRFWGITLFRRSVMRWNQNLRHFCIAVFWKPAWPLYVGNTRYILSKQKTEWICSLFKERILEKSEIRVNLEWTFCVIHSFWSDLRDHSESLSDPCGHSKMSE